MVKVALLARLVAKPGKEEEVAAFLSSALPLARAEAATIVWFALRISNNEFGIFDAFPDDAGREAHLNGPIAAATHGQGRRAPCRAAEDRAGEFTRREALEVNLPRPRSLEGAA